MDAYLQFNDESSYFKVDFNTRKITREHLSELKDTEPLIKPLNKIDLYYFKKDSLVLNYTEWLGKEEVLIKDELPRIDWVITNETKQINKFLAYKATGDFRGRKWIVWYAPELNFSAGPWKLYGLPGLILEAHDETHRYTFSAEKITFEKSDILDKDFTSFRNEKLKNATLKDFLNMQESSREAAFSRLSNNRGSVQRTSFPRSGMELIYEWEEESSEK